MTIEQIYNFSRTVAEDSKDHGYKDAEWPIGRTMVKAEVEMGEVINAYRDLRYAGTSAYLRKKHDIEASGESHGQKEARMTANYNTHVKNTVQDEFADVAIYVLLGIGNAKGLELKPSDRKNTVAKYAEYIKETNDFVTSASTVFAFLNEIDYEDGDYFQMGVAARYAIRLIDYLDAFMYVYCKESLEFWIGEKIRYNHSRPLLHGRKNDPTI